MLGSKGFWESGAGLLTAVAGVVTAVTGLLMALHQLGLLRTAPPAGEAASPPGVERDAPAPATVPAAATALVESVESPAPPPSPPDLSGLWRDATGTLYEIVRTGENHYRFSALNPASGYASQGNGILQGTRFSSEFTTNLPSFGHGGGTVSDEGRRMEGTFQDSALGSYSIVLFR